MSWRPDRRKVLQGLALAPLAARAWWAEATDTSSGTLFVGTGTDAGSKGIYSFRWNASTGDLHPLGLAAATDNPTFLALSPDRRYLYAANELESFGGRKSGAVSSFIVDARTGRLAALNTMPSEGTGTCHVAVDKTGQGVFCANYSGGSASSFRVGTAGLLTQAVSHFQYTGHGPNAERQEAPHAHRATVSPENTFVLINDLGLDCIHVYKLNAATAALTPHNPPQWKATPGSGPRALRFHPNGRWAYCVNELTAEVELLHWNGAAGTFTSVQKSKLTPGDYTKGDATGSEIVVDSSGHFAYAANRGVDQLISFSIDQAAGRLTLLARTTCGGKTPRHIALDPSEGWLLSANQNAGHISIFRRDTKTGLLTETGKDFPISKPECLVFA